VYNALLFVQIFADNKGK